MRRSEELLNSEGGNLIDGTMHLPSASFPRDGWKGSEGGFPCFDANKSKKDN